MKYKNIAEFLGMSVLAAYISYSILEGNISEFPKKLKSNLQDVVLDSEGFEEKLDTVYFFKADSAGF